MSQAEVKKVRYKMGKLERKNTLVAYSFLAPNFIGFAVFTLVPVICAILLSLFEWNGGDISKLKYVGLDNYATIFATKKVAEKGIEYFFLVVCFQILAIMNKAAINVHVWTLTFKFL